MRSLLAALCLLAPAAAVAIPQEIAARYQLTNNGVAIGQVEERFSSDGRTYSIRSVSRSEGLLKLLYDETIVLESSGTVGAAGLQPLQFQEQRTREPKRNVSATFDWERGVLHSRHRGEQTRHALPPGTQDRLSMMYQFMLLPPRGGNLQLHMSNGRKVERYTYRLVDEPRISTPAGEFDTLHFERVNAEPHDRRVEVWLAKERHQLPVRVVFDDPKGFKVEQTLAALQVR